MFGSLSKDYPAGSRGLMHALIPLDFTLLEEKWTKASVWAKPDPCSQCLQFVCTRTLMTDSRVDFHIVHGWLQNHIMETWWRIWGLFYFYFDLTQSTGLIFNQPAKQKKKQKKKKMKWKQNSPKTGWTWKQPTPARKPQEHQEQEDLTQRKRKRKPAASSNATQRDRSRREISWYRGTTVRLSYSANIMLVSCQYEPRQWEKGSNSIIIPLI